jgi:hypothetical protein
MLHINWQRFPLLGLVSAIRGKNRESICSVNKYDPSEKQHSQ